MSVFNHDLMLIGYIGIRPLDSLRMGLIMRKTKGLEVETFNLSLVGEREIAKPLSSGRGAPMLVQLLCSGLSLTLPSTNIKALRLNSQCSGIEEEGWAVDAAQLQRTCPACTGPPWI